MFPPFLLFASRGGFFLNRLYDFIIIVMPGSGYHGLALVNELSDLEGLLYEYVCTSYPVHTLLLVQIDNVECSMSLPTGSGKHYVH